MRPAMIFDVKFHHIKNLRIYNVSIHIKFHKDQTLKKKDTQKVNFNI